MNMNEGNEHRLADLKAARDAAMRQAERSAYAYFAECQIGPERTKAAVIHEGIYCTMLTAGLFAETVEATS